MTPGEDQIIMEGGGTTPINLADNQLLGYDDLVENPAGAVTPSGAVTESLSQMNMDFPAPTPQTNNPLVITRRPKEPPGLQWKDPPQ